jgi:hypothetical protein
MDALLYFVCLSKERLLHFVTSSGGDGGVDYSGSTYEGPSSKLTLL